MKQAVLSVLTLALCIGMSIASAETLSDNNLSYNSKDEKLVKQALRSEESKFGMTHIRISPRVAQLGRVYEKQGKQKEAEQLYRRAMDIQEAHRKHNDAAPWDGAAELFRLYQKQGRIADAKKIEAYRNQILKRDKPKLATKKDEKIPPEVSEAAKMIFVLLRQGDQLTEGELKQLIELHKKIPDQKVQRIGIAHAYCMLGQKHISQGKTKLAEEELQKGLQLARLSKSPDSIAESLSALGDFYGSQKQYAKQRSYLEQALAVFVKAHGDSSRTAMNQLARLIAAAEKQKDYVTAVAYSSKLVQAAERNDGNSDPLVLELKKQNAQLKKKL